MLRDFPTSASGGTKPARRQHCLDGIPRPYLPVIDTNE